MRRWRIAATSFAAAALVALAAGPASARETAGVAAAPTKITVAYANAAANFTPLFVGIGEGFFAKNGLDVSAFLASGGRGNAILQAGDAQFSLDSGEPNITAIARGGNFVMLGATANRFGFKLVARKPIAKVQDLRGKKLALSSPSAAVGTAGEALLKQFNMLGQVELVYIPSITARLAALEAGSVDAIILSPPLGGRMQSG
jgi:NitT/TauT family transport system substrate-binding protein